MNKHKRANTDWFRDAGWGVFMHYLADSPSVEGPATISVDEWNQQVDEFDVIALADQLEEIKAGYFFITIGQTSGFFMSPNQTYDDIVGHNPSRCSKRDLIADIIAELKPRGIRTMVYMGSKASKCDLKASKALNCTIDVDYDSSDTPVPLETLIAEGRPHSRMKSFWPKWQSIIREWSLRWGEDVHGWWFDGMYQPDIWLNFPDEPNFKSFSAAVKAGNPDSLVAWNPGVHVPLISVSEYEDYTAGEVASGFPLTVSGAGYEPLGRYVDGAQYHILSFLGEMWCIGEPRFSDEMVVALTKSVRDHEGVISWDIPHEKNGLIPEAFMKQFRVLRDSV